MKQSQKGFTLIELMIVIAIIGTLASVALPIYKKYSVSSKVVECVSLASAAKESVQMAIQLNGTFVKYESGKDASGALDWGFKETNYCKSVSINAVDKTNKLLIDDVKVVDGVSTIEKGSASSAGGTITATTQNTGAVLGGKKAPAIYLTPVVLGGSTVEWVCAIAKDAVATNAYYPSECRKQGK